MPNSTPFCLVSKTANSGCWCNSSSMSQWKIGIITYRNVLLRRSSYARSVAIAQTWSTAMGSTAVINSAPVWPVDITRHHWSQTPSQGKLNKCMDTRNNKVENNRQTTRLCLAASRIIKWVTAVNKMSLMESHREIQVFWSQTSQMRCVIYRLPVNIMPRSCIIMWPSCHLYSN